MEITALMSALLKTRQWPYLIQRCIVFSYVESNQQQNTYSYITWATKGNKFFSFDENKKKTILKTTTAIKMDVKFNLLPLSVPTPTVLYMLDAQSDGRCAGITGNFSTESYYYLGNSFAFISLTLAFYSVLWLLWNTVHFTNHPHFFLRQEKKEILVPNNIIALFIQMQCGMSNRFFHVSIIFWVYIVIIQQRYTFIHANTDQPAYMSSIFRYNVYVFAKIQANRMWNLNHPNDSGSWSIMSQKTNGKHPYFDMTHERGKKTEKIDAIKMREKLPNMTRMYRKNPSNRKQNSIYLHIDGYCNRK